MSESTVNTAEKFVFDLFKNELPKTFIYHNFTHTERVLRSLDEIIENSDLSEHDKQTLQLAALFHDTGYIYKREGHEEESVKIATRFLKNEDASDALIAAVSECIMATKFKEEPNCELGKILRDADASHFGKDYFMEASELLRKEWELQNLRTFTPAEWLEENIKVLTEKHKYYTDYALKNWQPQKEQNLLKLIKQKKKTKQKIKKERLKAKFKAHYKNESPERAIQTFYRVALRNHIKLSDIADTKANILLSVNAVIISLLLSNLVSKLDNPSNSHLILPTIVFISFSLISIIISVIATRPNVTRGEFTKEDVENKNVNLAFFGNFHKMELKDYQWALQELILDKDYLYSALTKDLYFLGKVLDRKYRLLRLNYNIFMIGLIISVIIYFFAIKSPIQVQ